MKCEREKWKEWCEIKKCVVKKWVKNGVINVKNEKRNVMIIKE
jgi:hypothetical protein